MRIFSGEAAGGGNGSLAATAVALRLCRGRELAGLQEPCHSLAMRKWGRKKPRGNSPLQQYVDREISQYTERYRSAALAGLGLIETQQSEAELKRIAGDE